MNGSCRRLLTRAKHSFLRSAVRILPNFPRWLAAFVEIIQKLFVLECIHGGKKTVVFKSHQLLLFNQASEGLNYKLVSQLHIFENVSLQNEKPCIDSDA